MELSEEADSVATPVALAAFARRLSEDFAKRLPDDWVNLTIEEYLEALSGWVEDAAERLEPLSLPADAWRTMAKALYLGKIYE